MIDGALLIVGDTRQAETRFTAVNPATGETLTPDFSSAGADAVAEACALADAAFPAFAATDPETRAAFLERIRGFIDELTLRAIDPSPWLEIGETDWLAGEEDPSVDWDGMRLYLERAAR